MAWIEGFAWINSFNLYHNCGRRIITLISHMRKMRHKEVKIFGQGHIASKWHPVAWLQSPCCEPLGYPGPANSAPSSVSLQRSQCCFLLLTYMGLGLKWADFEAPQLPGVLSDACAHSVKTQSWRGASGHQLSSWIWGWEASGRKGTNTYWAPGVLTAAELLVCHNHQQFSITVSWHIGVTPCSLIPSRTVKCVLSKSLLCQGLLRKLPCHSPRNFVILSPQIQLIRAGWPNGSQFTAWPALVDKINWDGCFQESELGTTGRRKLRWKDYDIERRERPGGHVQDEVMREQKLGVNWGYKEKKTQREKWRHRGSGEEVAES